LFRSSDFAKNIGASQQKKKIEILSVFINPEQRKEGFFFL